MIDSEGTPIADFGDDEFSSIQRIAGSSLYRQRVIHSLKCRS